MNDYIRRAETLKVAFIDGNNEGGPAPESKRNITSLQRIPSLEKSSALTYNELRSYHDEISKIKCLSRIKYYVIHSFIRNKLRILIFRIIADIEKL